MGETIEKFTFQLRAFLKAGFQCRFGIIVLLCFGRVGTAVPHRGTYRLNGLDS